MKVVINKCFGGFRLSQSACEWLISNKGWKATTWEGEKPKDSEAQLIEHNNTDAMSISLAKLTGNKYSLSRDDENSIEFRSSEPLIAVVIALGNEASGKCANLEIVEIPDDAVDPYIDEYDGFENVREGRFW